MQGPEGDIYEWMVECADHGHLPVVVVMPGGLGWYALNLVRRDDLVETALSDNEIARQAFHIQIATAVERYLLADVNGHD